MLFLLLWYGSETIKIPSYEPCDVAGIISHLVLLSVSLNQGE